MDTTAAASEAEPKRPPKRPRPIAPLPEGVNGVYTRAQVCAITTLTPTTLWRRIREGKFPKSVSLSPGRVAFSRAAVDRWVAEKLGVVEDADTP